MSYACVGTPCQVNTVYSFGDVVKVFSRGKGVIIGAITNIVITASNKVEYGVQGVDGCFFDFMSPADFITPPTGNHAIILNFSIGDTVHSTKNRVRKVICEIIMDSLRNTAIYSVTSPSGRLECGDLRSSFILEANYFET